MCSETVTAVGLIGFIVCIEGNVPNAFIEKTTRG